MHPPNINPALEMHVKQPRSNRSTRTNPPGAYPRLTQPLVRDNGVLRPASWDEALDRAAEGFRRNLSAARTDGDRNLQLLEVDQRGQLPGVEVRPGGVRQQQRRQLQPNLTRS